MHSVQVAGLVVLALAVAGTHALTYTIQFAKWYPQYGWIYAQVLRDNCSAEYDNYLTGYKNFSRIDWLGGGGTLSALTQPVIQCILSNISEYMKALIASSQVLLGVTPSVLSLVGPSTDESSIFFLVSRRPLLYTMLTCGSPSVYFNRAFEYTNPKEVLTDHPLRLQKRGPKGAVRVVVTLFQYFLALGAMVNTAYTYYELGVKSVCTFMSDWIYAPLLWGLLGIVVHVVGAVVMRLRIRRLEPGETATGKDIGLDVWLRRLPRRMFHWGTSEFELSHDKHDVRVDIFPESQLYIALAWILSTGTILHILLGTFIFSGTLFLGPNDAITVVARFLGSAIACRAVLMYELSGLRDAHRKSSLEKDGSAAERLPLKRGEVETILSL